ncbi:MAG: iron ABC transporter permease, partial [Candidatus Methanomethylophilaceae archaeon]|nr:iron ABC transporter permease [Candidatus Methanomethylophilaceae archaeon]
MYDISLADSITVFIQHLTGNITDFKADRYIWDVRLPRAIGTVVLGAGLSVAGAVMQNNFRNPLAEPYTMGISSGAFFGVVIGMVTGISILPGLPVQAGYTVNAFLFSLVPIGMILLISRFKNVTPVSMILIGIAIMFLFNSVSQILLLASSAETLQDAYLWRVGNTSRIDWDALPVMVPVTAAVIVIVWLLSDKLNVMYAGDRGAQSMGIKPQKLRLASLTIVSLMTASIVSLTGTIGFIGLVGPHIARIFVGSNNR